MKIICLRASPRARVLHQYAGNVVQFYHFQMDFLCGYADRLLFNPHPSYSPSLLKYAKTVKPGAEACGSKTLGEKAGLTFATNSVVKTQSKISN